MDLKICKISKVYIQLNRVCMPIRHYPEVISNPDFSKIEEEVLFSWKQDGIFDKSIRGGKEFVFFDGPPFANGLPHYGHLLTGFIKDLFARYQAMQGKKVERRFGWDCHGLPAEMVAEKDLSISGKQAIEAFGVGKFNEYCRSSVLRYTKEWHAYVNRQARWVDFEHDYKTMDLPYMESVIWAFKTLYDKGLIYKAMRVMPYSWACETPVSDFETKIDNSYREKQSKSVVLAFRLRENPACIPNNYDDVRVLVWTTTPWTLPSNLAIAVGQDIEYALINKGNTCYIVAASLAKNYEAEIGDQRIGTCNGRDLIGYTYYPLWNYFEKHSNAFTVLPGDFVTIEDGTGIVHIAPGFGEDDQRLCDKYEIELVCPVDSQGKFTQEIKNYSGRQVFEVNDDIIKYLKQYGYWLRTEQYTHSYPHCWRTDTPLIYKAVPSWYIKVTAVKNEMIAHNQKINWIPEHIKNGLFGKWLENARDWSISRNRYWGCPIPVWESDDPKYPHIEVYGSIEELERAFSVRIHDLHKPFIDNLVKSNPSDPTGRSMLRRVPEVLDCWFESGSMPYAQVHYPFENKDWFEHHFPADFIVEYVAQTRGWFYTLMVLSTALFGKPPFLNCICHGVILGDDGQKLSKRLKNYADPVDVFTRLGADAMRWFMVSSQVMRGQELVIDKNASGVKEALRSVIKPLWNAYNFFALYANIDGIKAEFSLTSINLLDRYIIAKCIDTIVTLEEGMDSYDTILPTKVVEEFIEILNNWYIRRSRERFWRSTRSDDKTQAYNTLYAVLSLLCRTVAPLLPLISEAVYMGINKPYNAQSVHLEQFPSFTNKDVDADLIINMERVRAACNAALHIRNEAGVRIRQPLQTVTFVGVTDTNITPEMQQLVLDEINVKEWHNLEKSKITEYANLKLQLNLPILGKRVPSKIQQIIKASKCGEWHLDQEENVLIAGNRLEKNEFELKLEPKPELKASSCPLTTHDALVVLDITVNEELKIEGTARDLVRAIQQARKEAGLNVVDRINVTILHDNNYILSVIKKWEQYIKEQTLSVELRLCASEAEIAKFIDLQKMFKKTTQLEDGMMSSQNRTSVDIYIIVK
ncbi:Isoleucine--tRNA ligase [Alphaproteobacteria bacterium]